MNVGCSARIIVEEPLTNAKRATHDYSLIRCRNIAFRLTPIFVHCADSQTCNVFDFIIFMKNKTNTIKRFISSIITNQCS